MPTLPLRAKDALLQALDVPPAEREDAFVAEACGTDARLREEVQSLLAYHEESSSGSGARHRVPDRWRHLPFLPPASVLPGATG